MFSETEDGGTPPDFQSVKFSGYGTILCAGVGTDYFIIIGRFSRKSKESSNQPVFRQIKLTPLSHQKNLM